MKLMIGLVFALTCVAGCSAQVVLQGNVSASGAVETVAPATATPVLGSVVLTASATSVVAQWMTQVPADSQLSCGGHVSADASTELAVLRHTQIVAGLTPSTAYTCTIASTNTVGTGSASASSTTTAAAATTPITDITLGSITAYDSINAANKSEADGFYNDTCANGATYFGSGDTFISSTQTLSGWQQSGSPAPASSNLQVNQFTSLSPLAGIRINPMQPFGHAATNDGADARNSKISGIHCQQGILYTIVGRQGDVGESPTALGAPQSGFQIIASPDLGKTFNNFQHPHTYIYGGEELTPVTANLLGSPSASTWGAASFLNMCGDDGTIGYLNPCNRHDNADAYVYLLSNDGCAIGGERLYLARVARAKLGRLLGSDYQFFTGGDGNLDTNWSATESAAYSMVSTSDASGSCNGPLGQQSIQYIPSLNRYVFAAYYWPEGFQSNVPAPGFPSGVGNPLHTKWPVYEAPHPWGPWTLIHTVEDTVNGYYNPVFLGATVSGNTAMTLFTGNYTTCCEDLPTDIYRAHFATMTFLH